MCSGTLFYVSRSLLLASTPPLQAQTCGFFVRKRFTGRLLELAPRGHRSHLAPC